MTIPPPVLGGVAGAVAGPRIGIDARFHANPYAGIARYTRELIAELAALETDATFVVFATAAGALDERWDSPRVEIRRSATPYYGVREQLLFGRELRSSRLDLVHFTNFNHPLAYGGPFVITIPDLTLLTYRGVRALPGLKRRVMRTMLRSGLARSRRVITVSEHQRAAIARDLAADPGKIDVTYEAADRRFRPLPAPEIEEWRRARGLPERFVLYTGQWREYKNVVRLLRAFRLVRERVPVKLVLTGRGDPAFGEVPATIAAEGLEGDVVLAGVVSDHDLVRCYNAAELFVFPSLVEGFGLPPLEAMACGTAVAASSAPPMPEVLGDAPAFFDPLSAEDMAATLVRVLTDPAERADLIVRGERQAARYSWHDTAARTYSVYEAALSA